MGARNFIYWRKGICYEKSGYRMESGQHSATISCFIWRLNDRLYEVIDLMEEDGWTFQGHSIALLGLMHLFWFRRD